jgi:MFS transporter, FSR family, fosmidomycin resistance protein
VLLSAVIEPVFGLLADAGKRRAVVLWGGTAFAASIMLAATAHGFLMLLGAYVVLYLGSGAFTSLSEAALMDLQPDHHERNMARWVLAGSIGVVAGPLILVAALSGGIGWRPLLMMMGLSTTVLVWAMRAAPLRSNGDGQPGLHALFRRAARTLRRGEVLRWLAVLQFQDLMVDVLFGFLALYFVDVCGTSPVTAGLAVAVWTAAGLAGDALVIAVLRRVPALAWLRWSSVAVAVVFPAFLLISSLVAKLGLLAVIAVLTGGWYAVPKARLYTAMAGASGTAASLTAVSGLAGGLFPLALGALASVVGLGAAMWACLLGPVGLLILLPAAGGPRPGGPGTQRSSAGSRR